MNNITDIDIINFFYKGDIFCYKRINKMNNDIKTYLDNRYSDSKSYKETILRIKNNIDIRPVCPNCGGEVLFIGKQSKLYCKFCCPSCVSKYTAKLNEQRYGTRSTLTLPENKEKTKQTLLKHYGVEHNWSAKEIHQKCINTSKELYGDDYIKQNLEKAKQTCLKKYGNENYRNIEKAKQTFTEHYGVNHPLKQKTIHKSLQEKRIKTLKHNNSWNISKIEQQLKQYFDNNNINYKYQYKSELYPYCCDFYFPDNDLYVEIQGNWTHGNKPFENTKEDNIKVNEWKQQHKKYYDNAINTWTIRDVQKRNIAKQNNLNYLEIFSIDFDICVNEIKKAIV